MREPLKLRLTLGSAMKLIPLIRDAPYPWTCEICLESELADDAVVKVTVSSMKDELLDSQTICRGCAVLLGFSPGK